MGTSYSFERCLGRGGFGEVYLATRRAASGMERRVAVKVLRVGLDNAELAVRRLKDEARLLAVLDHPVILQIIELTRIDGRIALVTEYIQGVDLTRFTQVDRLLPPTVVVSIWAEVADALDCAWTTPSPETGEPLHLVHRDIKPENIRLSRHGEIKLLDFGIARSEQLERHAKTATGHMAFTPGYTAPESFLSLTQDAPTDVFALGATVYRLIVGARFFEGLRLSAQAALCASERRFNRHVQERLGRVRQSPGLTGLLGACLEWDPAHRPTAAEVHHRAYRILEELEGPTLRRWLRQARLPGEREVAGAALIGKVVEEDDPTTTVTFVPFPPVPQVPEEVIAADPVLRAPSFPPPAPPRPPPTPPAPSRVPRILVIVAGIALGIGLALLFVAGLTLVAGGLFMI